MGAFSRGFSLVELMVTIAIASVLLMIATPSMVTLYKSARLSSQSDLMLGSLGEARLEAIRRRAVVTVCPTLTPTTATACPPTSSASEIAAAKTYWSTGWIVITGTTILARVNSKAGIVIDNTTAPSKIDFSGTLGSISGAATLKFCASGQNQQILDVRLSGSLSKYIDTSAVCL